MFIVGLTWVNYRYAAQNNDGNDFLTRWVGTREFIMKGQNPYSQETSQEILNMMKGNTSGNTEGQSLFIYPFYSILVFGPFAAIKDFVMARAIWMTVLEISLFLTIAVSLSLSRWRISRWLLVSLIVFSVFWYHGIRPVILGNAAVLCALLIAIAFLAIRSEHDVLGGCF